MVASSIDPKYILNIKFFINIKHDSEALVLSGVGLETPDHANIQYCAF